MTTNLQRARGAMLYARWSRAREHPPPNRLSPDALAADLSSFLRTPQRGPPALAERLLTSGWERDYCPPSRSESIPAITVGRIGDPSSMTTWEGCKGNDMRLTIFQLMSDRRTLKVQ